MFILNCFLAILAGISIVIARIINSRLAEKIGTFQGTLVNYIVGLSFSLLFLLISSETISKFNISSNQLPFWAFLGGLLGVLVIVLSNYITPKIPAFNMTLLIFIGQLFAGIFIDYFALDKLSIGKIIGGILVLIGLTYNLSLDKQQTNTIEVTE